MRGFELENFIKSKEYWYSEELWIELIRQKHGQLCRIPKQESPHSPFRDKLIRDLLKLPGNTYKTLAEKFHLTELRIRQIEKEKPHSGTQE